MLSTSQFHKAAKDFRAGKIDLQQFTGLVLRSGRPQSAESEPTSVGPSPQASASTDRSAPSEGPGRQLEGPTAAAAAGAGSSGVDCQVPGVGADSLTNGRRGPSGTLETCGSEAGAPPTEVATAGPAIGAGERLDLDYQRAKRCGWPEVIYAPGKTVADLAIASRSLVSERQDVLITRVEPGQAEPLTRQFPSAVYNPVGRTWRLAAVQSAGSGDPAGLPRVAVVSAGTGDIPVAEEARETLLWMGLSPVAIYDVGVAGPQRLQRHVPLLQACDVIVVAAGMEGALPSVVGGHVACPVVAVPTSVGYGAHFHGLAPLLGMLNSCAANVVAVNIDAGFKAGFAAGLIAWKSAGRACRSAGDST